MEVVADDDVRVLKYVNERRGFDAHMDVIVTVPEDEQENPNWMMPAHWEQKWEFISAAVERLGKQHHGLDHKMAVLAATSEWNEVVLEVKGIKQEHPGIDHAQAFELAMFNWSIRVKREGSHRSGHAARPPTASSAAPTASAATPTPKASGMILKFHGLLEPG